MDEPKKIGQRIRQARQSLGLSGEDFGKKIGGSHKQTISAWERGERKPSQRIMEKISKVTGHPVTWFYGENEVAGVSLRLGELLSSDDLDALERALSVPTVRKRVGALLQEVLRDDPDNMNLIDSALTVIAAKKQTH